MTLLSARQLTRIFPTKSGDVVAVNAVDCDVAAGELVVIHGSASSGKTTLLNLVGGLDRPSYGSVQFAGEHELAALNDAQLAELRRTEFGFLFQHFGLIDVLTVRENVEVPLRMMRMESRERERRVRESLDLVGLNDSADQMPGSLSEVHQQLVGVARAIVTEPRLILADEPAARLGRAPSESLMEVLRRVVDERGVSILMTTEDPSLVAHADTAYEMIGGTLFPA